VTSFDSIGPDQQDWHGRMSNHFLGNTAKQPPAQAATSMRGHDDDVSGLRNLRDLMAGRPPAQLGCRREPCLLEPQFQRGQVVRALQFLDLQSLRNSGSFH